LQKTQLYRINQFLAAAGVGSRRGVEQIIADGDVQVNEKTVRSLGQRVNPKTDTVSVRGQLVQLPGAMVIYLLNKPRGIISTASDERGRKAVTDLVPSSPRVFPIGRLDKESEGLIVLTNDGVLSQRLTHPRYQHKKRYQVWTSVPQKFTVNQILQRMHKTHRVAGKYRSFDDVSYLGRDQGYLWFEVVVHEGLKHLVRRLLDKVGLETHRLVRVSHGPFALRDLPAGAWRAPTPTEESEVEKIVEGLT